MSIFKTKFSKIDEKTPTYIIAEVAQAHDGSIGSAHSFIDALKKLSECCKISISHCRV